MTLEVLFLTIFFPAAAAVVAAILLRQHENVLALVGTGHLANALATLVRRLLGTGRIEGIGLIDPFLWLVAASIVVLLLARGVRRWLPRIRRKSAP